MALLKVNEKKKPVVILIAILAIVGSLTSVFITQCGGPSQKINMKPHTAIGQILAEEVEKLLDNKGQVVIVCMDTKKFKMPTAEEQVQSFNAELKKRGGVTVMATEMLGQEALGMAGPEMGLSSEMFNKLLSKYSNASAIVSFVGAPSLKDEEISQLAPNIPKVLVFSSFGMGLKKLFEENVVQVAIVPNFEAKPEAKKKPVTPREWFDQYYRVITRENADSMPF